MCNESSPKFSFGFSNVNQALINSFISFTADHTGKSSRFPYGEYEAGKCDFLLQGLPSHLQLKRPSAMGVKAMEELATLISDGTISIQVKGN